MTHSPNREGVPKNRRLDRALSYFLIAMAVITVGALFYVIDHPVAEKFTECGLLGPDGKAAGYPVEFFLQGATVVRVGYEMEGGYIRTVTENYGRVIVQVINREQQDTNYRLEVWINGQKSRLWLDDIIQDDTGVFLLKQGEKWEHTIGFAPPSATGKTLIEFVLYKEEQPYFTEPPRLWVNARADII